MRTSETTDQIIPALLNLHNDMPTIQKRRTAQISSNRKYRYADISDVLQQIRTKLAECGLLVVQDTKSDGNGGLEVTTRIWHQSGEWIEGEPVIMPVGDRGSAQDVGAASTYGRRYSLAALLAIATDDDVDGPPSSNGEQQKRRPFEPQNTKAAAQASERIGKAKQAIRDMLSGELNQDEIEAEITRIEGECGDDLDQWTETYKAMKQHQQETANA